MVKEKRAQDAASHRAREGRNAPDERGICLSSESVSTAQSTTSSPSARLGFMTLNVGMTHLKAPELCHWESARVESAAEECCETFTGATTSAGQGIVDTAAQDGLVGNKPFILKTHSSPLA